MTFARVYNKIQNEDNTIKHKIVIIKKRLNNKISFVKFILYNFNFNCSCNSAVSCITPSAFFGILTTVCFYVLYVCIICLLCHFYTFAAILVNKVCYHMAIKLTDVYLQSVLPLTLCSVLC